MTFKSVVAKARWFGILLLPCLGVAACGPGSDVSTTGAVTWAVLKCQYSDTPTIPSGADQTLERLFNGDEGVREYFSGISYGNYLPTFDIKSAWRTMGVSLAQDKAEGFSRGRRIDECAKAWGVSSSDYDGGIIAILNVQIDSGNAGNVLLDPGAWNVSFAAHEMLHHLGLPHSFDLSDRKNSSWSQPGEYFDPWDIMSAMAIFGFSNANGFTAGPDLALPFKLALGWVAVGHDVELITEPGVRELELRPYSELGGSDPLGVCADLADSDGGFTRYCAEYRVATGWDRAIGTSGVLVHFLKNNSLESRMILAADQVFTAGTFYQSPDSRFKVEVSSASQSGAALRVTVR